MDNENNMADNARKAGVQKAVAYFTQAGLARLLTLLRGKYIQVEHIGGQVILVDSTQDERRAIASFLGKPPYAGPDVKVRLVDIEKALQHSFQCSLPAVLNAFFPDQQLVTRSQRRSTHEQQHANFRAALLSTVSELPAESRGRNWLLHGTHGLDWLFSRYKNASAGEQERQLALVSYIVHALNELPSPERPERLALFAQRTSGDPHALDANRPAGRFLLLALSDLQAEAGLSTPPQDREHALRLYNHAGLLVDTISSFVAVFHLAQAFHDDSTPDPLAAAAGKRVLLLPMRQLLEWSHITPASANIYLFENPQVFEEVVSAQETTASPPTMVCTSGWPSVAALTLLDRLLAASPAARLFYSGDFDLKGLQIAAYMLARYPGRCLPWHMDTGAYLLALQSHGVPARANELDALATLADQFAPLVALMQEKHIWAYQEGVTQLLIEDLR